MYVSAASILHPGLSGKNRRKRMPRNSFLTETIKFSPVNNHSTLSELIEIEHVEVVSPSRDSIHESKNDSRAFWMRKS